MRVRRATHGGGIMKPVVIYRAPDEKRAIFFERFAATPFYGSDVSGEEARKHINANLKQGAGGSCRTSTYILDRMAAETITYVPLYIKGQKTRWLAEQGLLRNFVVVVRWTDEQNPLRARGAYLALRDLREGRGF